MRWMGSGELLANAGSLQYITFNVPFDRPWCKSLNSWSYWSNDRLEGWQRRRKCGIRYTCKSFQYYEVNSNTRTEQYMPRNEQIASMDPPLVMSMWNKAVYSDYSREALKGSDQD